MKRQTMKSVVIVAVAVGLLVSPVLVFAQSVSVAGTTTIAGLETQIQFLLQELATLRGKTGQGSSTPPNMPPVPPAIGPGNVSSASFCPVITRSLSLGSQGSDVMGLQNYLSAQGYLNVSSTGYFGPLTQAAVGRWQAQNNIAAPGTAGNGMFGPLSRGFFGRLCGSQGGGGQGQGGNNNTSTQGMVNFSANPPSGGAPLMVQFVASAPQGTTLGSAVSFGDGTTAHLGFVPVCSSCNAEGVVSHTYTASGTYTAMLTNGACSCPANGVCNCPNIQILATTTVVVGPAASTTTASNIQQLNAPGNVTLLGGNIAEVRNDSFYFALQSIASSSATIHITPVGCWNSFPSDPTPKVVCMIAMVPIPPQTLAVGQSYTGGNYSITLTQLTSSTATFAVN